MKKKFNILSIALLALFLSHYAGATMFFHTHNLDGKQVSHSHPYAPTANHTHSAAAFQLIAALSTLLFTASVLSLVVVVAQALTSVTSHTCLHFYDAHNKHRQLRAPPVC